MAKKVKLKGDPKLTPEQVKKIKSVTTDYKSGEDATVDDISELENIVSSLGYELTELGKDKFYKGSLDDFLNVWDNLENYIQLKPKPLEKKIKRSKVRPINVEPKTIETDRPKMKIRKPIEEDILSIKYTQGGDKVKVSTNMGEQVMSREDYTDFYRKHKDKIQQYRASKAKKVRRK